MDSTRLLAIKKSIVSELHNAHQGKPSSFPYIRHTLPSAPLVKDGELFQVIVIGGTVMRTALCKKQRGILQIISEESTKPPKFISKQLFLSEMLSIVNKSVGVIAINFAYPLEPVFHNGLLDGKLLSGSKENTFTGCIGEHVGMEITKAIREKWHKHTQVTVANDTICLLLAGAAQYPKPTVFGGIVGTGINFSFFDGDQAVNLEAAKFDKFTPSTGVREVNKISVQPGESLFEKEVAGAYLYQQYNLNFRSHELFQEIHSTEELAQLAREKNIRGQQARQIFDHSAALVACQIAGILEFKKSNCVGVMEGSIFWKAEHYKTLVETYISMFTSYSAELVKIDNDSILGGAMLVG
jgi:hexokinase